MFRHTIALATAALIAVAALPAGAIPPPPKEAVLLGAFYEAIAEDDEKALAKLVAPNAKFNVSEGRRSERSLEDFRKGNVDFYTKIPDGKVDIEDLISGRDRVTVRYRFSGTYDAVVNTRTRKPTMIDIGGVDIFRLEAGRIAEMWQLMDHLALVRQLGFKISMPG